MWSPPMKITRYWSAPMDMIERQAAILGLGLADRAVVQRAGHVQAGDLDAAELLVQLVLSRGDRAAHGNGRLDARIGSEISRPPGPTKTSPITARVVQAPKECPAMPMPPQFEPPLQRPLVAVQLLHLVDGETHVERPVDAYCADP